jgi:glycosyltransferase involved in cell wall biosynthesis
MEAPASEMTAGLRLSMVLIAKNEQDNVRPCFESFWDHVDEVVLCDTGSRDGTIDEARAFARERREPDKLIVGRFKWRHDFAAARTHAHSLATGDIHVTLDLDDRLIGGALLRDVAARFEAEPELDVIAALWEGRLYGKVWRPRFLRAPVEWFGATWELPLAAGAWHSQIPFLEESSPEVTDVMSVWHGRTEPRGRRDLEIALTWAKGEPDDWRPWFVAAVESIDNGDAVTFREASGRGLGLQIPDRVRSLFLSHLATNAHTEGEPARA